MKAIEKLLGCSGRLLTASKGRYTWDNPDNVCVFNAHILVDKEKAWYGDLDLTIDLYNLRKVSKSLKKDIIITQEYGEPVVKIDSAGVLDFDKDLYMEKDGKLVLAKSRKRYPISHESLAISVEKKYIVAEVELDFDFLKPQSGDDLECPYVKLANLLKAAKPHLSSKPIESSDIFLGPKTYEKVSKLVLDWMLLSEPDLVNDEYRLQGQFNMFTLCYSPNSSESDSIKEGRVYLRKLDQWQHLRGEIDGN